MVETPCKPLVVRTMSTWWLGMGVPCHAHTLYMHMTQTLSLSSAAAVGNSARVCYVHVEPLVAHKKQISQMQAADQPSPPPSCSPHVHDLHR